MKGRERERERERERKGGGGGGGTTHIITHEKAKAIESRKISIYHSLVWVDTEKTSIQPLSLSVSLFELL